MAEGRARTERQGLFRGTRSKAYVLRTGPGFLGETPFPDTTHGTAIGLPISWGGCFGGQLIGIYGSPMAFGIGGVGEVTSHRSPGFDFWKSSMNETGEAS